MGKKIFFINQRPRVLAFSPARQRVEWSRSILDAMRVSTLWRDGTPRNTRPECVQRTERGGRPSYNHFRLQICYTSGDINLKNRSENLIKIDRCSHFCRFNFSELEISIKKLFLSSRASSLS